MPKSMITQKDQTFAIYADDRFQETLNSVVERIEVSAASKSVGWIDELTDFTLLINDAGQKTLMMEAAILSTVKRLWDDEKISPDITSQWDGIFWNWARHVSQRGVELPTEVTLQNKISVYDFYFSRQNLEGGFCMPPTLEYEIEIKTEEGIATEEVVIENPNLHHAAYGKLLAAKGLAVRNKGNLSDQTIAMMINSSCTNKMFKERLKVEKLEIEGPVIVDVPPMVTPLKTEPEEKEDGPFTSLDDEYAGQTKTTEPELISSYATLDENRDVGPSDVNLDALETPTDQGVFYSEGILFYNQEGNVVPAFVLATPQDGADHPLVAVGQNYILQRFGIYDSELGVEPKPSESPAFTFIGDNKGMLTLNGYQFAELDYEVAIALNELLTNELNKVLVDEEKADG